MSTEQGTQPRGAGKSSFDLIDAGTLFNELELQKGMTFLDLACGFEIESGPSGTLNRVD